MAGIAQRSIEESKRQMGRLSGPEMPDTPETMDYQQALSQAEQILAPQQQQQMDQLRNQQISRGFYGQLPGDVMQQELGAQHAGQMAQFATDLQQQDFQRSMQQHQADMQQYQLERQESQDFWSGIGSLLGTVGGGVAGFALGGPAGALTGAQVGSQVF